MEERAVAVGVRLDGVEGDRGTIADVLCLRTLERLLEQLRFRRVEQVDFHRANTIGENAFSGW